MTAPALECHDLVKAFGGVPVLKGVSLTLAPGSVTALAGENGAGKSTMMKIASGQLRPDSGDVLIEGALWRARALEADGPVSTGTKVAVTGVDPAALILDVEPVATE